nr:FmdE family protein [Klebsiella pneumoniae]
MVLTGYLFVQHANRQLATPEQLQSIIHDTPCAAEAIRMALQANTGTSSTSLTFNDAKKMASECKNKEEVKAVREKQLNALNAMSK